jgi:hypothetical protein
MKFFKKKRDNIFENKFLLLIIKQQQTIMLTLADLQQAVVDLHTAVTAKKEAIAAADANAITPEQIQGVVDSVKAVQVEVESIPTA